MLITHFTAFAPSKSGMYESTKDQIKYERKEGCESHLIDTIRPDGEGRSDEWLETIAWKEAMNADIWVVHSMIPPPLLEYLDAGNREKHKIVTIMHGPCENMLLKEWAFLIKNIEEPAFTITHINAIWNYDACVVLNQHEYDISKLYDENEKLVYIPNSIDLERYSPDGYKWKYKRHPAIISCDVPRLEKLPVHIIFAMPWVVEKIPEARLNFFGIPMEYVEFFRNLVCRAKKRGLDFDCMEAIQLKSTSLTPFIRGADIGFNSNYSGIMSRVHMEMMAMGVPVVSYNGDYTKYHAKVFDLPDMARQIVRCWKALETTDLKEKTIEYAHNNFSRAVHIKAYMELYKKLLGG